MIDPTFPEVLIGIGIFLFIVLLLSGFLDGEDIFSLEGCGFSSVHSFGYGSDNGPHTWKLSFPESTGSYQSPINIVTRLALVLQASEPLRWSGYRLNPTSMFMTNDGNSVIISGLWPGGSVPNLKGGPLKDTYNFSYMIFHWGPSNDEGSEHTIDYVKYAMELQMVHVKNGNNFPEDRCLLGSKDGVVAISFFFQVTNVDNPYLDHVVTNLWRIPNAGMKTQIPSFPLEWIFPPFERCYYTYNGSLTQPPCTETVTWILQPESIGISSFQIAQFRKIRSFNGSPILLNTRPVQRLNDREVFFHD